MKSTLMLILLILPLQGFAVDDCGFFTNCSTQCLRNGTESYGHFCMFGTVCNPDAHRCEKPEAMIGRDQIGSKLDSSKPNTLNGSQKKGPASFNSKNKQPNN